MERISATAAGSFISKSSSTPPNFTHYSEFPFAEIVSILLLNMLRLCRISVKSTMTRFRPINSTELSSCHCSTKLIEMYDINKHLW